MITATRVAGTAIATLLALGALAACSSGAPPEPTATNTVTTEAPSPIETAEPAPVEQTPDVTNLATGWADQMNHVVAWGKYVVAVTLQ